MTARESTVQSMSARARGGIEGVLGLELRWWRSLREVHSRHAVSVRRGIEYQGERYNLYLAHTSLSPTSARVYAVFVNMTSSYQINNPKCRREVL